MHGTAIVPPLDNNDDMGRAVAYLRPLGGLVRGALDGLTVAEVAPLQLSPYLRLALPGSECLNIHLGNRWCLGDHPHEMIAPICDVRHAANEIISRPRRLDQQAAIVVVFNEPDHNGRPTW